MSTDMFEEAPQIMARYIGVKDLDNSDSQIVLTSNTTSALDLASHVFGEKEGIFLTTLLEHHSNDLPHRRRGKVLHTKLLGDGSLDLDDMERKLQDNNVKLVAVSAGSNVTGYMPPIHKIARMAHNNGAKILVDAAQRLAHFPINVKPEDHPEHIDFLAAAGHKTYAPFGASFLYGDVADFDAAPPYVPAGGTVSFVTSEEVAYVKGPEFLSDIGIANVRKHELELFEKMIKGLKQIDGVTLYGEMPLDQRIGVIPFNIHNLDHGFVSKKLDQIAGIATRNGCFCAHPYLLELLQVPEQESIRLRKEIMAGNDPELPGAVRASLGIYNTDAEVETFLTSVEQIAQKN
jgi:selenocysteine lyase/cysteine desulfurase